LTTVFSAEFVSILHSATVAPVEREGVLPDNVSHCQLPPFN